MHIVGIAGGSGTGKSTVSYALVDAAPETYEVLNLDDYQRLKTEPDLPRVGELINWDHPDVVRVGDLLRDLRVLRSGQSVTRDVWAHRSNSDYSLTGVMIPRTVFPRPVLLVEGYLALHWPQLRDLFFRSYYLELDLATRAKRRAGAAGSKNAIIGADEYEQCVLIPMHQEFVEPSKAYADVVLDVSTLSVDEVCARITTDLE